MSYIIKPRRNSGKNTPRISVVSGAVTFNKYTATLFDINENTRVLCLLDESGFFVSFLMKDELPEDYVHIPKSDRFNTCYRINSAELVKKVSLMSRYFVIDCNRGTTKIVKVDYGERYGGEVMKEVTAFRCIPTDQNNNPLSKFNITITKL